jgi:hypothetical protein
MKIVTEYLHVSEDSVYESYERAEARNLLNALYEVRFDVDIDTGTIIAVDGKDLRNAPPFIPPPPPEPKPFEDFEVTLKELPDFGDHMTREEFAEQATNGFFVDSDGSGYYATESHETNILANPSDFAKGKIRDDFTHIMWYNK